MRFLGLIMDLGYNRTKHGFFPGVQAATEKKTGKKGDNLVILHRA